MQSLFNVNKSMLVLLTVGPKCALAGTHDEYADVTDRQTDGRTPDRYITLSDRRGPA